MPAASLKNDIKYLKGVGPVKASLFSKLGIRTAEDLLFYYPRIWLDRRFSQEPLPPYIQRESVFLGKVISSAQHYTSGPLLIFRAELENGKEKAEVEFFRRRNMRFDVLAQIKKDFSPGAMLWVIGRQEPDFLKRKIRAEEYYTDARANLRAHTGAIVPVYSSTDGLSQKFFRETAFKAVCGYAPLIPEILPDSLLIKRALPPRAAALANLHFPPDIKSLETARKRAAYEEFLLMLCAWGLKKSQTAAGDKKRRYEIRKNLLTPFKEKLGFKLTNAQVKAINEIFRDMMSPSPMSRLLQGDVGCGKTAVALSAALLAAENGFQTAFMAPTEILALQHFETFSRLLKDLPVRIGLLTSSCTPSEKKRIREAASRGELNILIGTHALIEKEISFSSLGLTVIDEQHKFGVRQRAALREKGQNTDMLIMTATPIPRTLALSLYGDLEISCIDEMPPGRKPVKTWRASEKEAFSKLKEEILKGGQGYVVYPVIEENESDLKSLKKEFLKFRQAYPQIKSDLIYGTMKAAEKNEAMRKFLDGETRVLLATQVIEVGIDVKNASVMIIQNAERFGLAALHQLRGRIGRGSRQSHCFLVSEDASTQARERLNALCSTSSGFELSEKDAWLRGTGEVMGLKQHGDMELSIADPYADRNLLSMAIEDRDELLAGDPGLNMSEHSALKKKILELYGEKWKLIDAG